MKKLSLLAISYAKQSLVKDSREQKRMLDYASGLEQYHLIVFTKRKDNLPAIWQAGNLTVYGTNAKTKIGMLLSAYRIGKKIFKNHQSGSWVISSQDPFESSLVARRLLFRKNSHQVQLHGDFYGNPNWQNESWLNRLRAVYGLYVLKRAHKVRVVSERIKKSLLKAGVKEERITVLPIAVNLQDFLEIGEKRVCRDHAPQSFVFVGRLAKEKNVDLLIRAFAELARRQPALKLKVVGAGPEKNSLLQLVQQKQLENRVEIIDWTEDVPGEMSQADVLLLPSSYEGYGLVILEAMAAGLPVIATDVGCVGEVMRHETEGLVVDRTVESIKEAIATYLEDTEVWQTHSKQAFVQAKKFVSSQYDYKKQWTEALLQQ